MAENTNKKESPQEQARARQELAELIFRRLLDDLGVESVIETLGKIKAKVSLKVFSSMLFVVSLYLKPEDLPSLGRAFQDDVVGLIPQIGTGRKISLDVIQSLNKIFHKQYKARKLTRQNKRAVMTARLLLGFDPKTRRDVIDGLESLLGQGDYMAEVKDLSFCFEDLINLDPRSIQRIIAQVGNEVLTRSLYLVSPEVRERFFSAMSSGAATMVQEDLEVLGELPREAALEAQNEVLSTARKLEGQGMIDLKTLL